jgi:hypothetical protein
MWGKGAGIIFTMLRPYQPLLEHAYRNTMAQNSLLTSAAFSKLHFSMDARK